MISASSFFLSLCCKLISIVAMYFIYLFSFGASDRLSPHYYFIRRSYRVAWIPSRHKRAASTRSPSPLAGTCFHQHTDQMSGFKYSSRGYSSPTRTAIRGSGFSFSRWAWRKARGSSTLSPRRGFDFSGPERRRNRTPQHHL